MPCFKQSFCAVTGGHSHRMHYIPTEVIGTFHMEFEEKEVDRGKERKWILLCEGELGQLSYDITFGKEVHTHSNYILSK